MITIMITKKFYIIFVGNIIIIIFANERMTQMNGIFSFFGWWWHFNIFPLFGYYFCFSPLINMFDLFVFFLLLFFRLFARMINVDWIFFAQHFFLPENYSRIFFAFGFWLTKKINWLTSFTNQHPKNNKKKLIE